jgi:hypothetical protein
MSPLAMVVGATRLADNTAQGACHRRLVWLRGDRSRTRW